jgi:predicted RNA polymerase sigma factor
MRFASAAWRPSPVVRLHRAVAVEWVEALAVALVLVEELAGELERHHLLHATRADLLRPWSRGPLGLG